MLSVLERGHWQTRRDIFERVGFMLTNNAASELRARGYVVEQRHYCGNYEYRIQDSGTEPGGHHTSPDVAPPVTDTPAPEVPLLASSGSVSVQLQLVQAA